MARKFLSASPVTGCSLCSGPTRSCSPCSPSTTARMTGCWPGTSPPSLWTSALPSGGRSHPRSWSGLGSPQMGRRPPLIFIEEGVKIDQAIYLDMLSEQVVPWVQEEYPKGGVIFQQDGAPSHTAKLVQAFCKDMFPEFWAADLWLPSSPDLNPMDFRI